VIQQLADHGCLLLAADEVLVPLGIVDHEVNGSQIPRWLVVNLVGCPLLFDDQFRPLIDVRLESRFLVLLHGLRSLAGVHVSHLLGVSLLSCTPEPLLLDHLEFSKLHLFLELLLVQLLIPQLLEPCGLGLSDVLGPEVQRQVLVVGQVHG